MYLTHAGKASFSDKFARVDSAPYVAQAKFSIRALIDVASVEVFVDGGRLAMTEIFFPNEDFTLVQAYCKDGVVKLNDGIVYPLKAIWR